jgi:hypothetical protein
MPISLVVAATDHLLDVAPSYCSDSWFLNQLFSRCAWICEGGLKVGRHHHAFDMAYNPDNPNASSPAVLYVVAAVGPPSDDLLEAYYSCDYGFTHILQIFTGQRDPDATGKIGQFNVYVGILFRCESTFVSCTWRIVRCAPGTSWQMPYCLRPDCHVVIGPHAARRSGPTAAPFAQG